MRKARTYTIKKDIICTYVSKNKRMREREKEGEKDLRKTKKIHCYSVAFFDVNKMKPDYKNTVVHNIIVRSETYEMNK